MRLARTVAAAALLVAPFAGGATAATVNTIYNFCPDQDMCSDGNSPVAIVADADGNLFGTTFDAGAFNNGTISRWCRRRGRLSNIA